MILLSDLGNSRIKCAVWTGDAIAARFAEPHDGGLPQALDQWLAGLETPHAAAGCYVSSPALAAAFEQRLRQRWDLPVHWVSAAAAQGGVINGYVQPEQLGADRWVALLGAAERRLLPCCVVDCGTAATVDLIQRDGRHRGGLILPGLSLSREALSQRAHRLAHAGEGELPLLATETPSAIRSGTFHGLLAAIEGLYRRLVASQHEPPRLVLTGGDAPALAAQLAPLGARLEPDLLFYGLVRALREPAG